MEDTGVNLTPSGDKKCRVGVKINFVVSILSFLITMIASATGLVIFIIPQIVTVCISIVTLVFAIRTRKKNIYSEQQFAFGTLILSIVGIFVGIVLTVTCVAFAGLTF